MSSKPEYRLFRPQAQAVALGLAVNHLMAKPAFANLKFGDWSKILVGQINRGHYAFVVDASGAVQGFVGWALTSEENAEAWVGGRALSYQESLDGDCILFNAWSANSNRIHRFMVDEARKLILGRKTMYFRRHYADGSARPVRLSVNDFVNWHVETKARRPEAGEAGSSPAGEPAAV